MTIEPNSIILRYMSTTTLNHERISKILWHPLMYRLLKGVLVPVGIGVHDESFTSHESPRIDTVLRHDATEWTAQQRDVLPDGIRDRDCQHHILEGSGSVRYEGFK